MANHMSWITSVTENGKVFLRIQQMKMTGEEG